MDPSPAPSLRIVPGRRRVRFAVNTADGPVHFSCHPARFLDGLRTAGALLAFGEVQRDPERLDEILPWAGNV